MVQIKSIATKKNDRRGAPEKYNFRNEEDIRRVTGYVMKGNRRELPVLSSSRGFITSKNDPKLIADEMINVQKLHKKTSGIRIRGEMISVSKDELNEGNLREIEAIANGFAGYYLGRGHQAVYGIYDKGKYYDIKYAINTTNYTDGSKYWHNAHSVQEEEEAFLKTVIADVTGESLSEEERFDIDILEYSL